MISFRDLMDVLKMIVEGRKVENEHLASMLRKTASILDDARAMLERHEVPRRESYEMVEIINQLRRRPEAFRRQHPDLVGIFEKQIPHVGALMERADIFILQNGKYKTSHHHVEEGNFPQHDPSAIGEACAEMQRVAGRLSGYAETLSPSLTQDRKKPS